MPPQFAGVVQLLFVPPPVQVAPIAAVRPATPISTTTSKRARCFTTEEVRLMVQSFLAWIQAGLWPSGGLKGPLATVEAQDSVSHRRRSGNRNIHLIT